MRVDFDMKDDFLYAGSEVLDFPVTSVSFIENCFQTIKFKFFLLK